MSPKIARAAIATLGTLGWLITVAAGFQYLHAYESSAGPAGRAPVGWPIRSGLQRIAGCTEVVMAVHPKCPCTRAGLKTLGEIVRGSAGRAVIRLLVFRPADSVEGWGGEALQDATASIPGVAMVDDPGGIKASEFGLETSGAMAVFDADGRLQFTGGLSAGRGVVRPSGGADSLMAVLAGRRPVLSSCDAFGCPLSGEPAATLSREDGP